LRVVPFASKATSAHAWSVVQMLEELLADVKAGRVPMESAIVVYTVPTGHGDIQVHSWRAQVGWAEEYAYLGIAQAQCLRLARGE
jgi:hypothetical protein